MTLRRTLGVETNLVQPTLRLGVDALRQVVEDVGGAPSSAARALAVDTGAIRPVMKRLIADGKVRTKGSGAG